MSKPKKQPKMPRDVNKLGARIVELATGSKTPKRHPRRPKQLQTGKLP